MRQITKYGCLTVDLNELDTLTGTGLCMGTSTVYLYKTMTKMDIH